VGVDVGVGPDVGVSVGVDVRVLVGVRLAVPVGGAVEGLVGVAVGVLVGVDVGVSIGVDVGICVGVSVGVGITALYSDVPQPTSATSRKRINAVLIWLPLIFAFPTNDGRSPLVVHRRSGVERRSARCPDSTRHRQGGRGGEPRGGAETPIFIDSADRWGGGGRDTHVIDSGSLLTIVARHAQLALPSRGPRRRRARRCLE
jgi:hypothetical protein